MTTDRERAWSANRYWGDLPVPKAKAEFFNAVTTPAPGNAGATIATIRLYGPIDSWGGFWGISTKDVGDVIDHLPDTVTQIILRLNSPGGEVFEGVSILNMLRAHKASVTAVVDGLAASAAAVIAAGCDQTVMSPGTQLMIHSPWCYASGSATDLRKQATVLDSIEGSLIEIFAAKAGDKDWPTLLADETWLTATDAVDLGLADRVAVIPDAGESETVGEAPAPSPDPADPEDPGPHEDPGHEDSLAPRRHNFAVAASASAKIPSSTGPGGSNRKEDVMAYDDLVGGLRTRLGVTDAEISDELLLAALDEALDETAAESPAVPAGTVLIDASVLDDLQAAAADGRAARAQQTAERRAAIVATALQEGRITPATRQQWLDQLEINEAGTAALLASLPRNVAVATSEIGTAGDIELTADDAVYNSLFPDEKKGA